MTRCAQTQHDPAETPGTCLYVYGIVDSAMPQPLIAGAARGAELMLTAAGDVAAVHSRIEPAELEDLEPDIAEGGRLARLVRRHDEVVMALALAGPVLPVRLGTLVTDAATLSRTLVASSGRLSQALHRVRGRSEWNLRLRPQATTPGGADVRPPAADRADRRGTSYLMSRRDARRRAGEVRATLAEAIATLDATLSSLADATQGGSLGAGSGPTARAYLVAESARGAFVAAAHDGIAMLHGLGCGGELRGPLAPYSFADVRLGAGDG